MPKKVAFILDEMFEDSEFKVPYDQVREAGHESVIVGLEKGKSLEGKKAEEKITTEAAAAEVSADDFAALVIPGGYSPDKIRLDSNMVELTRSMYDAGSRWRRSATRDGCWPRPTSRGAGRSPRGLQSRPI